MCTLSPLDAAMTMRFAKNRQHDTTEVLCLPCKMTMEVCGKKCNLSSENGSDLLCPSHRITFDTLSNMFECHKCHTKRGCGTLETSKSSDHFLISQRSPEYSDLTRTLANGCKRRLRMRTVARRLANTPWNPQAPKVKREPLLLATHSGNPINMVTTATAHGKIQTQKLLHQTAVLHPVTSCDKAPLQLSILEDQSVLRLVFSAAPLLCQCRV